MFEADKYMFKPDLEAGYYQVDTHPEYHKYLGFQWELEGILCSCHSPFWALNDIQFV